MANLGGYSYTKDAPPHIQRNAATNPFNFLIYLYLYIYSNVVLYIIYIYLSIHVFTFLYVYTCTHLGGACRVVPWDVGWVLFQVNIRGTLPDPVAEFRQFQAPRATEYQRRAATC